MARSVNEVALSVKRVYREACDPLSDKFAFERRPDEVHESHGSRLGRMVRPRQLVL